MILIFGGAYQGKLEYAKNTWNFCEEDIFRCEDNLAIDLSKKVIYGLHHFCFACACEGSDTLSVLEEYEIPLNDKIFILDDISQGVVPSDADERAWREEVGRTMLKLSKDADEVYRVFCGLGQRLK